MVWLPAEPSNQSWRTRALVHSSATRLKSQSRTMETMRRLPYIDAETLER